MSTHLPADYPALLADIKQRVRHAQTHAMLAVNAELIRLYWDIGALIDQRQKREGWGAAVIPRLAKDLHNELPEEKGFSERSEEHTSELQSPCNLVCRLLLEKKTRQPPDTDRPTHTNTPP